MKWKAKYRYIYGEIRIVKKFAFFPTQVKDKKIWWETYYEYQYWHARIFTYWVTSFLFLPEELDYFSNKMKSVNENL